MSKALTPRQSEMMAFVRSYIREYGYSPTYSEISAGLGNQPEAVVAMARLLERHGHLVRVHGRKRCLAIAGETGGPMPPIPDAVDSLTSRERKLYDFIRGTIQRTGMAPSVREMSEHMTWSSIAYAFKMMTMLENKGVIRRVPKKARAITLVGG